MTRLEALDEYSRAQKQAQRSYREKIMDGQYPYLPALDDWLEKTSVEAQLPLGTIEIPLELVTGTNGGAYCGLCRQLYAAAARQQRVCQQVGDPVPGPYGGRNPRSHPLL